MSALSAESLAPLYAPLTELRGIGPALGELLARATGGTRVIDLLFHLPDSYLDWRERPTLKEARAGQAATMAVEVVSREEPASSQQPWRVIVTDGTAFAEIVYFGRPPDKALVPKAKVLVPGKITEFAGRIQIKPERIVPVERAESLRGIEPVWGLTAGLWPRQVANAMRQALTRVPEFPEWHDAALLRREKWPGFGDALGAVQAPEVLPGPEARKRLAYDELLADQVALAIIRGRARKRVGRVLRGDGRLRAQALATFGHQPTEAQRKALAEIDGDLSSGRRMLRLLQGDVGSGKTLVAALAMLRAVEAGAQAALMAPTEVLARQHQRTLSRLCPVPVGLLTGSVTGSARRSLLAGLASGEIPIVVGTHALFQDAVEYHDLALAVIDEQHRFGVAQRLQLGAKGETTDVLVMTATPIPRTLQLTQWGEMDVSRLGEKPAGRQPIRTSLHSLATLPDVLEGVARKLDEGARVYWVCPLVAESEVLDVAAAEERFAVLRERFGDAVGLAHGRMESEARQAALADFAAGRTRLLVATTVVEVGVDVPEASVMVIEHAERFGLAQLHQLRGRVGRGAAQSFCLLLHADGLGETARRRLQLLRETEDGFRIADEDFRTRGGGDVLGTRQSGLPGFRLADPVEHEGLLHMAHQDAALLLQKDPGLTGERGRAVRLLLRLFERAAAMQTLVSG